MKEIVLNTVKKTSPNYRKYIALIDDEDFEKVNQYNWCILKIHNICYAQAYNIKAKELQGEFAYQNN